MTPFYTRKGDEGFTGWIGKGRLAKNDPRIEALGTIDETTSALGLARSLCKSEENRAILLHIQRDLYVIMSEVASDPENLPQAKRISGEQVAWIEAKTDLLANTNPMPKDFIAPGDSQAGAALDLGRTFTRRAERRVVELAHQGGINNPELLRYLNRLSSLCFVLELSEGQLAGVNQPTLVKEG